MDILRREGKNQMHFKVNNALSPKNYVQIRGFRGKAPQVASSDRETWLNTAVNRLNGKFFNAELPRCRASCGWPARGGLASKRRRYAECWPAEACTDKKSANIFMSPLIDDPECVLSLLAHELCHVAAGKAHGSSTFKRYAREIGFKEPFGEARPGPELAKHLKDLARELGAYPHSAIEPPDARRRQSTRLRKVVCPNCGYTVRTTRFWIDQGLPRCHDGGQMQLDQN